MAEQDALKDFFISYNRADRAWAEWMAWQLQVEGYTVVLQAWDFRPGGNFVLQMNEAVIGSKRTIALLSPDYLDIKAVFSHAEWAAAFVQDPEGQKAKLLPIRVRECTPTGLFAAITYIDLVDRDEAEAYNELISGVRRSRNLPLTEPLYPGKLPPKLSQTKSVQTPDFPGDWPAVWHVPYDQNRFFTGRDDLLLRLHDVLASVKPVASIQVKAINGLGGIGKTQTALEYVYRYAHEYHYLLWVNALTAETLTSDIVQLATILQLPEDGSRDPRKTIDMVKRWLALQRDWLLVVDNADNLRLITEFLPQGARTNGHVLLTTRASAGGALAEMIEVEKMDTDEGVLFLLRRMTARSSDVQLAELNPQFRADTEAIVRLLDGLPLAIDQAGAYIEERGTTPSAYLKLYQTRHADLLRLRGQFPPGHPETVATTWSLSFQQVEQANPVAADLLRLLSFLAPDDISESLIIEGAAAIADEVVSSFADSFILDEAIEVLRRFSLVRRSPGTRVISVHRLVQVTLQDIMNDTAKKQWAARVVSMVNAALPRVHFQRFDLYQKYFSHAQVVTDHIRDYQLSFVEAAQLLYKIGWYVREQGQYEQAESFYALALDICQKELGQQHKETAAALEGKGTIYFYLGKYEEAEELMRQALAIHEHIEGAELEKAVILNNLANLDQVQGKYEEAEELLERALAIHEHIEGAEMEKAIVLNNLANLYQVQGKYDRSEELLERALAIHEHIVEAAVEEAIVLNKPVLASQFHDQYMRASALFEKVLGLQEKALGSGRPATIATLLFFANLYQAQGKYGESEVLYQRALSIQEKALGPDHPYTGAILQGLANLYQTQGKYVEAEPLYQRALAIREKTMGSEHPDVAGILQGLANLYRMQGKYAEAEPLYQRALNIQEKALGPDHPFRAGILQGLAELYQAQGKYEEAEPLYLQALDIQEELLGPDHPDTGGILQGLANLYQAQGKYEQAEPIYQRTLGIVEQVFGLEHANTGWVLQSLADLYRAQGDYEEAEPLTLRALNIHAKAFGVEHPHTLWVLQKLAELYQAQGKYEEAEALYLQILGSREKTSGPEHPEIIGILQGLVSLSLAQQKNEEAEALYLRILHIQERTSGPEHPEVIGTLQGLASLYRNQGKYEEAEDLYRRVITIREHTQGPQHIDTASTHYILAHLYLAHKKYKEAAQHYQITLHIVKQAWGPQHPHMNNMLSMQRLADAYQAQGKYQEAAVFYQRAISIEKPGRLKMYVGEDLVPLFDPEQGGNMLKFIQNIRDQLVEEQGFILPAINIQDALNIDPLEYELLVDDEIVLRQKIYTNVALLKDTSDFLVVAELETVEPGYDVPVIWLAARPEEDIEKAEYQLLSATDIICANLKSSFIENKERIIA